MKALSAAALAVLVSFLSVCSAHGADATAEALFRAGRDAAEAGNFELACERFAESQRLEPAMGTLFNLAHCREKLGQIATAWRLYTEVKDRLPASDERAAFARSRAVALEKRLPTLTLELSADAAGATLLRDGIELGDATLGLALPVDPGKHEIVVRLEGREDRRIAVEIGEGEEKTLVVEPGPALAPGRAPTKAEEAPSRGATADSAPPGDTPSEDSRRTIGFAVGSVGIAGILTSLATGAAVLSRKNIVERECENKLCTREGVEAGESGKTLSAVSTVAFAVGAAGLGLGAYFLFTSNDGKERARVELRALPHAAAVNVGGRF